MKHLIVRLETSSVNYIKQVLNIELHDSMNNFRQIFIFLKEDFI